ncbi:hypothetical protein PVAP13_6NG282600 [Panicum virgatum]|uniref:Uncharacterized protein n=1 Tax=Panicum virgatum TaxID=38727 RepID=A0A8T0R1F2_PANVG|nr:hypothetical protein PVAP13_6NG282600 [Panicum virgatum]
MPRRGKSKKPPVRTGDAYVRLPLPSGVSVPMCFCGDPCKVDVSIEEDTYKQRYWMCANYAFDPTPHQIRIGLLTPPPLCDFEQWIDTEIKEEDKRYMEMCKKWEAERLERVEKRRQEEAAEKERHEEQQRLAAKRREEREWKLERARRAKAAMEENPDALRKEKWPRCMQ